MHVYVLLMRGWRPTCTRASHSPISPELNKFSSTCPKLLVLGGWPLVTRTSGVSRICGRGVLSMRELLFIPRIRKSQVGVVSIDD